MPAPTTQKRHGRHYVRTQVLGAEVSRQLAARFQLLAGDVAAGAVSFRCRSGEQNNGVPVDQAVAEITDAVNRRIQG